MPSLDPHRPSESAEESALREELRMLLGAPDPDLFEAQPTPEMITLADDLRREAQRRRRMAPRSGSSWMLLAAALPIALVLAGMTAWGVQQKRRADAMAAVAAEKEQALQMANSQVREQQLLLLAYAPKSQAAPVKAGTPSRPVELVIPADRPALPPQADTLPVKSR